MCSVSGCFTFTVGGVRPEPSIILVENSESLGNGLIEAAGTHLDGVNTI